MSVPFYEIKRNDIVVKKNERELLFPPHFHKELEIVYVLRGTQGIKIGKNSYYLNAGAGIIIFPEEIHEYLRDKSVEKDNKNAELIIIVCNTKIFNDIFPDFYSYKASMPLITKEKMTDEARDSFVNIYNNPEEYAAVYGWVCVALNYMLKSISIEKIDGLHPNGSTERILNYIADNFTDNITLDTLSSSLHLSKYYISHIFSEKLKINFRTYIGMLRAEYAAKLIRTTDNSITEISGIAGFDNTRTFNRIFSRVYGMTPTEYKDSIKKLLQ